MTSTRIEPFWNRLPAIMLYPFRGGALVAFILLGLAQVLIGWLPFVSFVLWLIACKQAFEILLTTANGKLEAPAVGLGIDNSLVWQYLLLQILFFGVPVLMGVLIEPALGLALFVAFAVALPAAIMGLAISGSLGRAISPDLWLSLIARIGWPYLALIGLLLVIQLSAANAEALLEKFLPALASSVISVAFSLWSMFATFHLMGYLIYQFHEALGFEPSALRKSMLRTPQDGRDAELLERAGALVQAGDVATALQALRVEIRSRAVSIEVQELYRRLLQQAGSSADLLEHGRQFLHQLLMEKQEKRALALANECLGLDPAFTALELEQNALLAKRATFAGQTQLAINLLLAAVRHPTRHADKPQWALQAADLMSRQSGREQQARELLLQARADCNDGELRGRIDAQLALLPAASA